MKFLFSRLAPNSAQSVLLVQTCNCDLLGHVAADVRKRFYAAKLTVLAQKGMQTFLPTMSIDEMLENPVVGQKAFAQLLRQRHFDVICFCESGESGFWKLKLLPFYLRPRGVIVYDRLAHGRPLSLAMLAASLGAMLTGSAPTLNARRLVAPLVYWRLRRFYRERTNSLKK